MRRALKLGSEVCKKYEPDPPHTKGALFGASKLLQQASVPCLAMTPYIAAVYYQNMDCCKANNSKVWLGS